MQETIHLGSDCVLIDFQLPSVNFNGFQQYKQRRYLISATIFKRQTQTGLKLLFRNGK